MSFKIAIGRSQKKDISDAAQEAAISCLSRLDPREAGLAILFTTPEYASIGLLKKINSILKSDIPLIGCCGSAVFSSYGAQKEGIILMLIACARIRISSAAFDLSQNADVYSASQNLSAQLLSQLKGQRRETGLLFSSGSARNTSAHIKGLQNILGKSFPFIGAGANTGQNSASGYLYSNQNILGQGISAALFAGKFSYGIGLRHGWRPLGKLRAVSESSGNIIKSIDGLPARRLYEDYFAKNADELKTELAHINTLYPIGIRIEGENEYLLRSIISFDPDGSLLTQGDIPRGSQIRLMIATKESCLESSRQAALQAKVALKNKIMDFALVISSSSRYHLLGRNASQEIQIIKDALGDDVPFAGFYSFGEYAPLGSANYYGQTYFHNQSLAILGMGE